MGGRAVQQNIHGQLPGLAVAAAGKDPLLAQCRRPPGRVPPQPPHAAQGGILVLLQQQGVLQFLGELGDCQTVLQKVFLIVRPIFLPLPPKVFRIPGGVCTDGMLRRRSSGKVQPAVPVYPRAQLPLCLRQLGGRQHGRAEAVLHIAPQDGLRGLALEEAQQAHGLSGAAPGVFTRVAPAQSPESVGPDQADAAALADDAPPGEGRPLAVGNAAAGPAKECKQQFLRSIYDFLLVPPRVKFQGRQHLPQPRVLGLLSCEDVAGPGGPEALSTFPRVLGMGPGQSPLGIFPSQTRQGRPRFPGPGKHRMLHAQPEHVRI